MAEPGPRTVRPCCPTTAVKTSNWGHFEQPSGSWAWIGPPSKKHNAGGARWSELFGLLRHKAKARRRAIAGLALPIKSLELDL